MRRTLSEPTLDALFDSPARTRVLKLFLYNPDNNFETTSISKKLGLKSMQTNRHLSGLADIGFLTRRMINGKKSFKINRNFDFYNELRELVSKANPASKRKMLSRLNKLGKIKLALLSGIFMNSDISPADILVVGDGVKLAKFNNFIKNLEAEIGKEINYAFMTTKEFYYRYGMYDRFLRDLLDFKHEKLIDKLKI